MMLKSNISFLRYCVIASALTFITSIAIGWTYRYFMNGYNLFSNDVYFYVPDRIFYTFLGAVVIGPLLETLVDQWLLISILQKFRVKAAHTILLGTLVFSLSHLHNSVLSSINTLFLGFVLCYSYIYWLNRTSSERIAFESSLLIHVIHNLYHVCLLFFYSR